MSTRHGRRPGRLARRAVIGAVAAWFATVGGVAGVSWLAIQSAGYAVTGSRLIGISLDAPPAVASRPTAAPTDRPVSGSASASRSAVTTTRSVHPTPSASGTPSGPAGAGGRSTTVPNTGQTSHNGGRGGGSSTGAPPANGQDSTVGGQGPTTPATATSGGRNGGQFPSSPSSSSSTQTVAPTSTAPSSPAGSGVTSQSTPGGFVVAECSGDVVHWSVEPASGWSTLQSGKIEHGVTTGFRRSDRVVAVTITCDNGTPTIVVRTSASD